MKIIVEIDKYDHPEIPEDQHYIAVIKEGSYIHTVVTAGSVADCFKELATSIHVTDEFRKLHPEYARTDETAARLKEPVESQEDLWTEVVFTVGLNKSTSKSVKELSESFSITRK